MRESVRQALIELKSKTADIEEQAGAFLQQQEADDKYGSLVFSMVETSKATQRLFVKMIDKSDELLHEGLFSEADHEIVNDKLSEHRRSSHYNYEWDMLWHDRGELEGKYIASGGARSRMFRGGVAGMPRTVSPLAADADDVSHADHGRVMAIPVHRFHRASKPTDLTNSTALAAEDGPIGRDAFRMARSASGLTQRVAVHSAGSNKGEIRASAQYSGMLPGVEYEDIQVMVPKHSGL